MNIKRISNWQVMAQGLAETVGDSTDERYLFEQFRAGIAQGYCIDGDTWLLVRPEPEYKELVIVAMRGHGLADVLPRIIDQARADGFATLRAHTQRPGLLRLVQRIAPKAKQREIVIGMEL